MITGYKVNLKFPAFHFHFVTKFVYVTGTAGSTITIMGELFDNANMKVMVGDAECQSISGNATQVSRISKVSIVVVPGLKSIGFTNQDLNYYTHNL